jgi:hypothetical protein
MGGRLGNTAAAEPVDGVSIWHFIVDGLWHVAGTRSSYVTTHSTSTTHARPGSDVKRYPHRVFALMTIDVDGPLSNKQNKNFHCTCNDICRLLCIMTDTMTQGSYRPGKPLKSPGFWCTDFFIFKVWKALENELGPGIPLQNPGELVMSSWNLFFPFKKV